MRRRQLGLTDVELSVIGLGSWSFGGTRGQYNLGPQNEHDSIATIQRALECGINWIDTAPAYGFGYAEEIIGKALKFTLPKPYIATKCGIPLKDSYVQFSLKRDSIRTEIEASLKRLGVESIDLYQIHWPHPDNDLEEGWETLVKLKEEGKIRHLCASNFSSRQLKRVHKIHPVASLQTHYSMLTRDAEYEVFDYCMENNISVLAYSPLETGILSGYFDLEKIRNLSPDDYRLNSFFFREPDLQVNLKLVEGLRRIAEACGQTVASLSLAWVLKRPEVTATIVGATSASEIDLAVKSADFVLSKSVIENIQDELDKRQETRRLRRLS